MWHAGILPHTTLSQSLDIKSAQYPVFLLRHFPNTMKWVISATVATLSISPHPWTRASLVSPCCPPSYIFQCLNFSVLLTQFLVLLLEWCLQWGTLIGTVSTDSFPDTWPKACLGSVVSLPMLQLFCWDLLTQGHMYSRPVLMDTVFDLNWIAQVKCSICSYLSVPCHCSCWLVYSVHISVIWHNDELNLTFSNKSTFGLGQYIELFELTKVFTS